MCLSLILYCIELEVLFVLRWNRDCGKRFPSESTTKTAIPFLDSRESCYSRTSFIPRSLQQEFRHSSRQSIWRLRSKRHNRQKASKERTSPSKPVSCSDALVANASSCTPNNVSIVIPTRQKILRLLRELPAIKIPRECLLLLHLMSTYVHGSTTSGL